MLINVTKFLTIRKLFHIITLVRNCGLIWSKLVFVKYIYISVMNIHSQPLQFFAWYLVRLLLVQRFRNNFGLTPGKCGEGKCWTGKGKKNRPRFKGNREKRKKSEHGKLFEIYWTIYIPGLRWDQSPLCPRASRGRSHWFSAWADRPAGCSPA